MRSVRLLFAVAFLLAMSSLTSAQSSRSSAQPQSEPVPLKAWSAPLYFQPTPAERGPAIGNAGAFSALSTDAKASAVAGSLAFVAVTPCRVVDTRSGSGFTGSFGPPSLFTGASRTFPIQSSPTCSIPSSAQAYSLNITVVPPGPVLFLTVWPTGQPQPLASTINDPLGTIIANAAVVPAGSGGSIDVFASNTTDIIIDINGYYVSAPQDCVSGFNEAYAAHQAAYTLVQNAITPAASTVDAQLKAVVDQPTYQTLLNTARSLATSITNGRIVITQADGTVVIDTARPDDPTDVLPAGNSYKHFTSKTVNENHNSRLAIFLAQEYPCGIGIESKFSSTTGQHESYVAIRLGDHLDSNGTLRGSTF